jgi:hypothetical protein
MERKEGATVESLIVLDPIQSPEGPATSRQRSRILGPTAKCRKVQRFRWFTRSLLTTGNSRSRRTNVDVVSPRRNSDGRDVLRCLTRSRNLFRLNRRTGRRESTPRALSLNRFYALREIIADIDRKSLVSCKDFTHFIFSRFDQFHDTCRDRLGFTTRSTCVGFSWR